MPPSLPGNKLDPIDLLDKALEYAWEEICCQYDLRGPVPDLYELFNKVELESLTQAAEAVLVNMLTEATIRVDRFSPWYTKPARSFGLISIYCPSKKRYRWVLAPETRQLWREHLNRLTRAISKNTTVIQASRLVGQWVAQSECDDPCVTAFCHCYPPHSIQIRESVLKKHKIFCEDCNHPYC